MRTQSVGVIVAGVLLVFLFAGKSLAQQIPDPLRADTGRDSQSTVQKGDTTKSVPVDASAPSEKRAGEPRSQEKTVR